MSNLMRKRTRAPSKKKKKSKYAKTSRSTKLSTLRYGNLMAYSKLDKGLLGKRFRTKLVYLEPGLQINPGAAAVAANYVFSANGCYDPNVTGIGHQPSGFDQLMTFFDHYTVISSKIFVHYRNTDTLLHQYVGVYLSDSSSTETDKRVIIENGLGNYTFLAENGKDTSTADLCLAANMSKFLGRPDVLSEDDLRGGVTSNPAEQAYFHVWTSPTMSADASSVDIDVRIEYVVEFTEPNIIPIS